MRPEKPLLVYDGNCQFCSYWVEYWRELTNDRVDFQTLQSYEQNHPDQTDLHLRNAIALFTADDQQFRGAAAAFALLSFAGSSWYWWCYRYLPLFATVSEFAYQFIAGHRPAAMRIARLLWGERRPVEQYSLVRQILLRGLGCIYVFAFLSMHNQVLALIGENGILPLVDYLRALLRHYGTGIVLETPMVFWLAANDRLLELACLAGTLSALALTFGYWQRLSALVCWCLYLSLFYAAQLFTGYQWDLLLLEAGFAALLLPGRGGLIAIFCMRVLTAKFMFMAGYAKLLGADPVWLDLTALNYHFQTQPLPTALAWYAHQFPETILKAGVIATFVVELVFPVFLLGPRRPRHLAAGACILFELAILATGSYNFFNLLTIVLLMAAFDDQALHRFLRAIKIVRGNQLRSTYGLGRASSPFAVRAVACLLIMLSLIGLSEMLVPGKMPQAVSSVQEFLAPVRISNRYGLFVDMTTARREIIIEGSAEGREWLEYVLPYQAGPLARAPRLATPHQPRLDWQMWFAALGSAGNNPWFGSLLQKLLEGNREVLSLFQHNPFPEQPPRYLRARSWKYRFTTPQEREESGHWWVRTQATIWHPVVSLKARVIRY